jgi:CubicO group peptidase (beta-lactamase class C family)
MHSMKLTDDLLKKLINVNFYEGIVIKIMKDNKLFFESKYGYSNLENKTPIEYNNLFKIMSMSKPITSSLFLLLMQEQVQFQSFETGETILLSLETLLRDIFPEWAKEKICTLDNTHPKNDITIKHMLTMTSGISYQNQKSLLETFNRWRKENWDLETLAIELSKSKMTNEPGETFVYGLNMDIIAAVGDRILKNIKFVFENREIDSWISWVDYILKSKLAMINTHFANSLNAEEQKLLVRTSISRLNKNGNYDITDFEQPTKEQMIDNIDKMISKIDMENEKETLIKAMMSDIKTMSNFLGWQNNLNENQLAPLAGSTFISDADDYLKFENFLLTGNDKDGNKLLSDELRKEMIKNQLTPEQLEDAIKKNKMYQNGYGYGVGVKSTDQIKTFYNRDTFGWDGMLGSLSLMDSDLHLSIVVMTNSITTNSVVSTKIFDTIYQDLFLEGTIPGEVENVK